MKIFCLFAFNALMLLGVCTVVYGQASFSLETDLQALLGFKSQVSEDKRQVLASWNHTSSPCSWIGVTCGPKHERVTSLDLGGFKLSGSISPSIGNLSFLRLLNLADNSFESVIPQEIGMLFRLRYLNMSYNLLKGTILPSLSNCSKLATLDLSSNHLGHEIPSELGSLSMLATLDLNKNNLAGKFPASLGNLTSLQYLDFAYNHMDGEIPVGVARLTQMVFFQISINNFSGVFPPALYNISSLVWLSLANNRFSGNLRGDFGDLLPKSWILEENPGDSQSNVSNGLFGSFRSKMFNIPLIHKSPYSQKHIENHRTAGKESYETLYP